MGSVPRINHLLAIVSWDLSQPFPSEIYLLFWITLDVSKQYECLKNSTYITTRVKVFQLCHTTTLFARTCSLYPITSNSKAAWGLLVYLEIGSIFTAVPVSLSQWLRQLLHREIIHARHHLNAKVFRYLRTLIGKAAIKWGFLQNLNYSSRLRKSVNQPSLGR